MSVVTLLLYPLRHVDPGVSSGVLYVLGVLLVATYWGVWVGVVTSFASAAALDYFHASPGGDVLAADAGDVAAIGVLLLTALAVSLVADRARTREEVRASRARVIKAADEERRRVARDLHDGAQQRLFQTIIELKLARHALQDGDEPVEPHVADALEQAEGAMSDLRELAHGILPRVLTRGGLRAAVKALASRMSIPVELGVSVERLPPMVEASAYFVVAEALTNVAKRSGASHAAVSASIENGILSIQVRDDGAGDARADGNGLIGLADRLAALEGRLRVESPSGGGTLIAADIPIPTD